MRKDGVVTKQELMNTALKLFYKNGYESTSVQAIIDEVRISKGGFYHHFKSKKELLEVIIGPYINILKMLLQNIVDNKKLDAVEKLNAIILTSKKFKASRNDISTESIKLWLKGTISLTDPQVLEKTIDLIIPLWQKVIEQGKNEGKFDTSDPKEATNLIVLIATQFNKTIGDLFIKILKNPEEKQNIIKIMEQKSMFFENTLERLLGVKGQIHFAEPYMSNIYLFISYAMEPMRKFMEENNLI